MHASVYGGIALYHLWHSLLDSWRSTLDLSSACTPAVPSPLSSDQSALSRARTCADANRVRAQVPPFISEHCLPDLTAYLPLHVLLSLCFFMVFLGVHWGGFYLQIPAFITLGLLLFAIW
jgi:hypothetical protein